MLIKHSNETSDENERSCVAIQKSKPFFFSNFKSLNYTCNILFSQQKQIASSLLFDKEYLVTFSLVLSS